MSRLYDEIVSQRGSFERLVAKLPGFKGYHEKNARRTADDMLRDHIAAQISQRVDEFERVEKLILNNVGMSYMTRTRDVKGKIRTFHDKVKTATPGYSGMWAQMKIGPDELDEIYAFDEAMLRYVDQLDVVIASLKEAALTKEGIDAAIVAVDDVMSEAIQAYALRDDVLTRFSADTL